jgi:hypothetical protein
MLENVEGAEPQKANDFGGSGIRRVNYDGRTGLGPLQFFQEPGRARLVGNREADQYNVEILGSE